MSSSFNSCYPLQTTGRGPFVIGQVQKDGWAWQRGTADQDCHEKKKDFVKSRRGSDGRVASRGPAVVDDVDVADVVVGDRVQCGPRLYI